LNDAFPIPRSTHENGSNVRSSLSAATNAAWLNNRNRAPRPGLPPGRFFIDSAKISALTSKGLVRAHRLPQWDRNEGLRWLNGSPNAIRSADEIHLLVKSVFHGLEAAFPLKEIQA
jgi:hypothetical protein